MKYISLCIICILVGIPANAFMFFMWNAYGGGKGKTDCMIEYVEKYYPVGCTYMTPMGHHIDQCGITYLELTGTAHGCMIRTGDFVGDIYNSTYCFIAKSIKK